MLGDECYQNWQPAQLGSHDRRSNIPPRWISPFFLCWVIMTYLLSCSTSFKTIVSLSQSETAQLCLKPLICSAVYCLGHRSLSAGIPDAIFLGEFDHRRPFPGDHGIRFRSWFWRAIKRFLAMIFYEESYVYGLAGRSERRTWEIWLLK